MSKEEGRDNDLLDLIAADEMFHLTKEELEKRWIRPNTQAAHPYRLTHS